MLVHYGICILCYNGRRSLFLVYYLEVLISPNVFIILNQFSRLQNSAFLSALIPSLSLSYGAFLFLIGAFTLPQKLEGILANVVFFIDCGNVIILTRKIVAFH